MEDKVKVGAGIALVAVLALAAYYSGIFSQKGAPDIALSVSYGQSAYAGEASEILVSLSNNGSGDVSSALLQFSVDGVPAAQKTFSLPAGGSVVLPIKWYAQSPGSHSVRIVADAGNAVAEANEGNNEFSSQVSVLPRVESDVFAGLPDEGILRAYNFTATTSGLNQILGILSSGGDSAEVFTGMYGKAHEAHLGILHYANGSEAAHLMLQSELTAEEFSSSLISVVGSAAGSENRTVNGRKVTFVELLDGKTSFCAWQEGGWGRAVMYKRFFPPVDVFNASVGENTTCLDVASRSFNASHARDLLAAAAPLSSPVSINASTLLEGSMRSGSEKLYVRGFSDSNSAYLIMVSDSGVPAPANCPGTVINGSNKSVCHMESASLMQAVELEAYARKQGAYTIVVFIVPFQGTSISAARLSALETVRSVVFQGAGEYVWGTTSTAISYCDFPKTFMCSFPSFSNGTLKVNMTLVRDSPVVLRGFKCTQEADMPPPEPFALSEPITFQPNQTIEVSQPCYISGSNAFNGSVILLNAKLYANYSSPGANESELIKGALLINNFGG